MKMKIILVAQEDRYEGMQDVEITLDNYECQQPNDVIIEIADKVTPKKIYINASLLIKALSNFINT